MDYPTFLRPSETERFTLSTGDVPAVPKARPTFARWLGEAPSPSYGNKPILDWQGEPVFAELAILRAWEAEGWQGVWVDSFGKRFLTGYWPKPTAVAIPARQRTLLDELGRRVAGARCWDVFCWRDDVVIFSESKRSRHDHIRNTQRAWLAAGLEHGLPLDAFLVVEWSVGAAHAAV